MCSANRYSILGGELDNDTYQKLNDCKTLCLPEGTDAKYLSATLSQADVQALKNDIYQSILFPNPESAYWQDMDYYNEQMKKWEPVEVDETEDEGEGDVRVS